MKAWIDSVRFRSRLALGPHFRLIIFCSRCHKLSRLRTARTGIEDGQVYEEATPVSVKRVSVLAHRGLGPSVLLALDLIDHSGPEGSPLSEWIQATRRCVGEIARVPRYSVGFVPVESGAAREGGIASAAGRPPSLHARQKLTTADSGEVWPTRPPVAQMPRGSGWASRSARARAAALSDLSRILGATRATRRLIRARR